MRDVKGLARLSIDEIDGIGGPVPIDQRDDRSRIYKDCRTIEYGPIIPPPLPDWVKDGVPVPRKNTGPNLTQQRIDEFYQDRQKHREALTARRGR